MKTKIAILAGLFILCTAWCAIAEQDVFQIMGSPYFHTVTVTTTDNSTLFTTAIDTAAANSSVPFTINWSLVRSMWITCEGNDARFSVGIAATHTLGNVVSAGTGGRLPNNLWLKNTYVISKTAGSAATLQISLEH